MSLADQQWCPTSVQVTVLQARGLRIKGKSGTNDAYAVMQVGKEKYQTSVVEKSVAPVWKEEASFDLPQLQLQHGGGGGGGGGGTERSTLHVHVLHRALVGPDKLLGQAVINLLQLSQDKTRNKTEWFKLLDKTGKADKDRGEVLVDIQFMRNNMTASMFDLSAAGKSRSRLGKFKDKVRGKKKESDAASTAVPSFPQVLMDSEEEEGNRDGEVAAGKDEKKKKKMKSLFSPKSNLQRNMSQSMSVLPAKNSLSGSQSSGLNVDSSEGKKKFKFMIHKRSGSSDSKDSSSSGHQKHGAAEQSNLCINGSHIYCDEPPPRTSRTGSNFSLTSSGHGSMEDVPESSPPSVDSLRVVRQYSPWTEEEEETAEVENIKEDEGELRKEEEERRRQEEEEGERLAEEKRTQERRRIQEEEKRQREEEERIRMEEERAQEVRRRQEEELKLAEEKRKLEEDERRIEEEKVKKEEEERIRREEEERAQEEGRRQEERARRQEEERKRLAEEKRRLEEEEMRIEEEEKRQREERIRMEEEEEEEEERAQEERRRQEEECKLAEEKRRQEEEERRIEEEKARKEEEERIRREEEERVQEERRRQEEEEKARRQEEECKVAEEKRLAEEERRRVEEKARRAEEERIRMEEERVQEERRREEEMVRRQENEERQEKIRLMEQERRQREEEEKRMLEEEERKRIEAEEKNREEEEEKRRNEKRMLEEQERRRIEEEEKRQREEEERIRKEEERRQEEEERTRKEKEEYERLEEEKMRQDEQERRRIEEEERIREERIRTEKERRRQEEEEMKIIEEEERMRRKGKGEEEATKLEKEKLTQNAEGQKRTENKTKHKVAGMKSAEVTSINPFVENNPNSPAGPDSSTDTVSGVQQRSQPAASSLGSRTSSSDEKDLVSTQREKRPAPQPPGRTQAQSQRESDGSAQHLANKQGADVKTVSVLPQRSVQMIAPLSRSPTDANTQSLTQSSTAKGTINEAKHSKRPAPSRPRSVEEGSSPGPKTPSSDGKIPNKRSSEAKQEPIVYGLNPFEDDEDENELAVQDDTTTTTTTNAGSTQGPPAVSPAADEDADAQAKIKSSKKARAPPLPAVSADQNTVGGHGTGVNAPDNGVTHPCEPKHVPETPVQSAGGKKEGPPPASRRLQPVKPLSPLGQPPVSVVQGKIDNKSTGIIGEVHEKTKVNDTGLKGPYSQLTRAELISLVLKQENQLSDRDKKISELEQYIDNLLVRVIEESPSILMSMNSLKKTV